MKILVTGANGLLGQKLIALLLQQKEVEVVATSKGKNTDLQDNPLLNFRLMDITDATAVDQVISEEEPEVVIHTAAMTHVDQCEQDQETCWKVNVEAVKALLEAAKKVNAFFVHLSTDFIFSGAYGPLAEHESAAPVNYYGESKAAAETLVQQSGPDYAIIRTALVYGICQQMSRSNIVLWVKKSLEEGKPIKVVDDQYRTPTLAEDLAQGCWLVAKNKARGVFHISDEKVYTPHDMALLVARHFNLDESLISRTDSARFTQPARRPLRTGFIIEKAKQQLGYQPHSFTEGLAVVEAQIHEINRRADS